MAIPEDLRGLWSASLLLLLVQTARWWGEWGCCRWPHYSNFPITLFVSSASFVTVKCELTIVRNYLLIT